MATLRNVIIGQLRRALGELERPESDECEVEIYVGDHDIMISTEELDTEVDPDNYA